MSGTQRKKSQTNCVTCGATTNKGKRFCSQHHPHPDKGVKPHRDKYGQGGNT